MLNRILIGLSCFFGIYGLILVYLYTMCKSAALGDAALEASYRLRRSNKPCFMYGREENEWINLYLNQDTNISSDV